MGDLKLLSLNVRGLNTPNKRKQIWHYILHHDPDVIMLQETHLMKTDLHCMTHPKYPQCNWAYTTSKTLGVGVLCKANFYTSVVQETRDRED